MASCPEYIPGVISELKSINSFNINLHALYISGAANIKLADVMIGFGMVQSSFSFVPLAYYFKRVYIYDTPASVANIPASIPIANNIRFHVISILTARVKTFIFGLITTVTDK